jgi:hypothetical protein
LLVQTTTKSPGAEATALFWSSVVVLIWNCPRGDPFEA